MSATGRLMSVDGSAEDTTTGSAPKDGAPADWQSVIIDVSDLSLTELAARYHDEGSPLARSLRRLADDLAEPGRPIAGFNSAI